MASRHPGKTWPWARRGQGDISGFPSRCLPSDTWISKEGGQKTTTGVLESWGNAPHLVFLLEPSVPSWRSHPPPRTLRSQCTRDISQPPKRGEKVKMKMLKNCGSFHYVPTSNFNAIISAEDLRGTGSLQAAHAGCSHICILPRCRGKYRRH